MFTNVFLINLPGTGAKQVLNDLKVQFTNITFCKAAWGEDLILPTHMCVGDGFDGACLVREKDIVVANLYRFIHNPI